MILFGITDENFDAQKYSTKMFRFVGKVRAVFIDDLIGVDKEMMDAVVEGSVYKVKKKLYYIVYRRGDSDELVRKKLIVISKSCKELRTAANIFLNNLVSDICIVVDREEMCSYPAVYTTDELEAFLYSFSSKQYELNYNEQSNIKADDEKAEFMDEPVTIKAMYELE